MNALLRLLTYLVVVVFAACAAQPVKHPRKRHKSSAKHSQSKRDRESKELYLDGYWKGWSDNAPTSETLPTPTPAPPRPTPTPKPHTYTF